LPLLCIVMKSFDIDKEFIASLKIEITDFGIPSHYKVRCVRCRWLDPQSLHHNPTQILEIMNILDCCYFLADLSFSEAIHFCAIGVSYCLKFVPNFLKNFR